jgi:5-hydroxyisourate hydrolase-like protein (transthyretin family)
MVAFLRAHRRTCWMAIAFVLALFAGRAEAQSTGQITGTVTAANTGLPIAGIEMRLSGSGGTPVVTAGTDPAGGYVFPGLTPGTYHLRTNNGSGYIDELYDNMVCALGRCQEQAGTPIVVTAGATTSGINFALDPGATITGRVSSAATNAGLNGVSVQLHDALGNFVAIASTTTSGTYTLRNLAPGTYFLTTATTFPTNGYTNQLYKDATCSSSVCEVIFGTPVSVAGGTTVAGIDFALVAPGAISGRVTDATTGAPLSSVFVDANHEGGLIGRSAFTDADGRFTLTTLPVGAYSVGVGLSGYIGQAYPTTVVVTTTATTSGVNFALSRVGTIAGRISDAATGAALTGVTVSVYNVFNQFIGASTTVSAPAGSNNYTILGLPPGAYYLRTTNTAGYLDELYNDGPCPGGACTPASGTPVQVTNGAATSGIDFSLTAGSRITGTVTEEGSGVALSSVTVLAYDSTGAQVASTFTNTSGVFTLAIGRPTGSFFLRTSALLHVDELYGGNVCPLQCDVTTGTPVVGTVGTTVSGIDFALALGGTIAGTVTNTSGAAINAATIAAFDASGTEVAHTTSGPDGSYVLRDLATGSYYLRTRSTFFPKAPSFATEYLHEVYDDIPCPDFSVPACTATSGTAVSVTTGAATSNINFELGRLDATGAIAVSIIDAATNDPIQAPQLLIYDSAGTLVRSLNPGLIVTGLPSGTYFLRARAYGYLEQLYDVSCPGAPCPATSGTPVTVTFGATTSGINIRMHPAGRIGGVVTDAATHAPLAGVRVVAYDASGTEVNDTTSDTGGRYVLGDSARPGFATGTYFVRTATTDFVDQQYRGRPCIDGACVASITSGTAVAVTAGAATLGVDFALARRGITANPTALRFGATKAAESPTLQSVTPPQSVMVGFTSSAGAWTATTSAPWLQLTGNAGTGPGSFTVAIVNPSNVIGAQTILTGTITLTATAGNLPVVTLPVTLRVMAPEAPTAPFGMFETPVNGASVAGSIAVTGWALDDIGIARVELWRDRVAGETTQVFVGGLGNGKIFIADASFIAGARPDVETAYASFPFANQAGWGYLLLTQGLWNQGNGSYTLHAFAYDTQGNGVTLGSKTITVNNATATRPFGSIDTPAQGQTVTGGVWNFGWALTPNATPTCTIGPSGVQVSIDSGPLQPVSYGDLRPDIAAAFPGYSNGAGAGGAYYIDTTTLANGTHSIGWLVTDSCGRAEGIGSRFFTVFNSSSSTVPLSAVPTVMAADAMRHAIAGSVTVRRGLDATSIDAGPSGAYLVRMAQNERVEIELPATGDADYVGYQIVNGARRGLPQGSSFDGANGVYYWQPAAGFLGAFDLEFVPFTGGVVRVRVVIGTSVQSVIDTPAPGPVTSPFVVAGWAIEEASVEGTGIDTVHVWAYPVGGGAPIFVGVASYGDARADIGAIFGDQFARAGYGITAELPPGVYDVVVYPHSAVTGDFRGAVARHVTVR